MSNEPSGVLGMLANSGVARISALSAAACCGVRAIVVVPPSWLPCSKHQAIQLRLRVIDRRDCLIEFFGGLIPGDEVNLILVCYCGICRLNAGDSVTYGRAELIDTRLKVTQETHVLYPLSSLCA